MAASKGSSKRWENNFNPRSGAGRDEEIIHLTRLESALICIYTLFIWQDLRAVWFVFYTLFTCIWQNLRALWFLFYTLFILQDIHATTGVHLGFNKTQSKIAESFYWQGITNEVKDFIAECDACQISATGIDRNKQNGSIKTNKFHLNFTSPDNGLGWRAPVHRGVTC